MIAIKCPAPPCNTTPAIAGLGGKAIGWLNKNLRAKSSPLKRAGDIPDLRSSAGRKALAGELSLGGGLAEGLQQRRGARRPASGERGLHAYLALAAIALAEQGRSGRATASRTESAPGQDRARNHQPLPQCFRLEPRVQHSGEQSDATRQELSQRQDSEAVEPRSVVKKVGVVQNKEKSRRRQNDARQ